MSTCTTGVQTLFAACRRELFVALVVDVLDKFGLQHQFLRPCLKPIDSSMVILGRAMPVLEADFFAQTQSGHAAVSCRRFGLMFEALDDLKPGDVYVCAGAVVHGFHRDTREILRLQFPVASFGSYAQDQGPRGKVVDWRVTIEMNGVRIQGGQRQLARGEGLGLGLGLYIVQQIVLAHQGSVDARVRDTNHTEFVVRIPRATR